MQTRAWFAHCPIMVMVACSLASYLPQGPGSTSVCFSQRACMFEIRSGGSIDTFFIIFLQGSETQRGDQIITHCFYRYSLRNQEKEHALSWWNTSRVPYKTPYLKLTPGDLHVLYSLGQLLLWTRSSDTKKNQGITIDKFYPIRLDVMTWREE